MLRSLLAGLLLLIPSVASAATYYVSPDSNGVNNTFTFANPGGLDEVDTDSLSAGDVVQLHVGTYTVFIPQQSGTSASRITYIGDLSDRDSVVINANPTNTCGGDYSQNWRAKNVTLKGMTFTKAFRMWRSPCGEYPENDSLITAQLDLGLDYAAASTGSTSLNYLYDVELIHPTGVQWKSNIYGGRAGLVLDSCHVVTNQTTGTQKLLLFGDKDRDGILNLEKVRFDLIRDVAVTAGQTCVNMYRLKSSTWTDVGFYITNNGAGPPGGETSLIGWARDGVTLGGLTATRCSLVVQGTTDTPIYFNQAGSYTPPGGWTWTDCYFSNSSGTGSGRPGIQFDTGPWQDTYTRCTFLVNPDSIAPAYIRNVRQGVSTFDHCTFASIGNGAGDGHALQIENNGWAGTLDFHDNIIYTTESAGGSATLGALKFTKWGQAPNLNMNYNLFMHFIGDQMIQDFDSLSNDISVDSPAGVYRVGQFPSSFGETNSVHGTPKWTDSTFAAFDGDLLSGSFALLAGTGGSDIGPQQSTADVVAPDSIADLNVLYAGDQAMMLQWTAVGDDSSRGTVASYDVRYSTSAITAGNFSSATQATWGTTVIATAGVSSPTSQLYRLAGLTPVTQYWCAIKASDEDGNEASISNIINFYTMTSGGGGGGPFKFE